MVKFCQFVLKILSGNEILAFIKGHNSGKNVQKIMCNNPKLYLVNMNAYIKFGDILSIFSRCRAGNKILAKIKGHTSVTNVQKMTCKS